MKISTLITVLSMACILSGCMQYRSPGGGPGAVTNEAAEEALRSRNFWRGGIVGETLEVVPNATAADVSSRVLRSPRAIGSPVEYTTEDGGGVYRADPLPNDSRTKCRRIREQFWTNNRLIRTEVREVCGNGVKAREY